MNRQYSISGFSLYEILFAVAITAILAAIALPAYPVSYTHLTLPTIYSV